MIFPFSLSLCLSKTYPGKCQGWLLNILHLRLQSLITIRGSWKVYQSILHSPLQRGNKAFKISSSQSHSLKLEDYYEVEKLLKKCFRCSLLHRDSFCNVLQIRLRWIKGFVFKSSHDLIYIIPVEFLTSNMMQSCRKVCIAYLGQCV